MPPRRTYKASRLLSAEDDSTRDESPSRNLQHADAPPTPEAAGSTGASSSIDRAVLSVNKPLTARPARRRELEVELQRLERQRLTVARELEEVVAADAAAEAKETEEVAPKAVAAAGEAEAPLPFWRTRLRWAKFWVVVTGIWWGICMQLLYYQGASSPASALPNVDWCRRQ